MRRSQYALSGFLIALILTILLAAEAFAEERLAVNVPLANIRAGNGTDFEILWKVGRFHPLVVVARRGQWCYFRDYENDNGWIHCSLLAPIPSVITRVDDGDIRTGPGLAHPIYFTTAAGVALHVLERQGEWLRVQHADGDEGWIHEAMVW